MRWGGVPVAHSSGMEREVSHDMREGTTNEDSSTPHGKFVALLAALIPPVGAVAVEAFYLDAPRWSLLYPAVFISSLLGGLGAGIVSTAVAAALMWWFFVPPRHALGMEDPRDLLVVTVFVVMGIVISVLHSRMRRSMRTARAALESSHRANHSLIQAMAERRIFLALIENSSDFIGIADADGNPTYLNPAGRRMVGLAPDFPVEKTRIPEYYPPDVRAFVESVIVKNMKEKGVWRGETSFRHWQTEQAIPVDDTHFMIREREDGRVIGMGTITRDISELKRVRDQVDAVLDELEQTSRDLRDAQRLAHIGSWRWDLPTNAIRWSEELYRIYGRDPAAPPPRLNAEPMYTPASKERLKAAIEKILADGAPYELDLDVVRPDGGRRTVLARAASIQDTSGRVVALSGTAQDVTELRHLERLREEWMSVIAHDLRQPIGVIKTSAELLPDLHTGAIPESERKITARIRSAATGLARMVDDMLDASRIEAHRLTLQRSAVSPVMMVRESVERLSQVNKDLRVELSHGADLDVVFADPVRVEQVVGNLLSNAVKYGDPAGKIDVRVERRDNEIEIAISNPGRGIPAEEIPTLFDRFARSAAARKSGVSGLGIGLYIARGLVEAHGGRIWAESVPGETTTFRFTLPVATPDQRSGEPEQRRVA
jgi:PAS domain S-box-containing protein